MIEAIVFLPLLGAIIAGLFGPWIGARASEVITSSFMVIAALLSVYVFVDHTFFHAQAREAIQLWTWMDSGLLEIDWKLRADALTITMLVVVTGVSSLVHIYSIGYMHEDPDRPRFFSYLSLFTFAMLMLVTADNFVQLFFGWEGVGLASYLLIGFWYKKPSANSAAIKAFVVNRVGDFGLLLGIFGIFMVFDSVQFDAVFNAITSNAVIQGKYGFFETAPAQELVLSLWGMEVHALTAVGLLLFLGAMGKSAQFLLHTWLPDAMEGPTPVSALIHAATMVTAGVFLVCRASPLYEFAPDALAVIAVVGGTTAFFAATIGLAQNDIKRVVAYSTCSQLGYMFFAAGVGAYQVAMFHLFTHAFFKALLFLGAGSVIHGMHHEQDMRRMGGIYKLMPATYILMLIGTLALTGVGIPFLKIGFAGFYSKDAAIEVAFAAGSGVGIYAFWLSIVAALLTAAYSWRLIFMTFHGKPRAEPEVMKHAHDEPSVMMWPLIILGLGALFAGAIFYEPMVGHHAKEFWGTSIFIAEGNTVLKDKYDVPAWVLVAPVAVTLFGFMIAYYFYIMRPELPAQIAARRGPLYLFLYNKWFFDELYDAIFVKPTMWLGRVLWKGGDGKIIDGFGPDGIAKAVSQSTKQIVRLQTGYLYHYAFVMLVGIAALVTWFSFTGL